MNARKRCYFNWVFWRTDNFSFLRLTWTDPSFLFSFPSQGRCVDGVDAFGCECVLYILASSAAPITITAILHLAFIVGSSFPLDLTNYGIVQNLPQKMSIHL